MTSKILVIDDDPFTLSILEQELRDAGYHVVTAPTGEEGLQVVGVVEPDLVLLDYMLPGMDGRQVLQKIRDTDQRLPVIVITAHGTIDRAVHTVKQGASDFITKPFESDHVLMTIRNTLDRKRIQQNVELLSWELNSRYDRIIGKSPQIQDAIATSKKVARTSSTVLLLGDSGSGKELFARKIHYWSERREQPFIIVNCVGLSKELLESELFGHEKGAFTGAHQVKKGKMEIADGGTVFLDEVGDISFDLQTKLLRFLQEREFERVGGTKQIRVDVRIIAATNRELDRAVEDGSFRRDLFFRLNVVPLLLPPLRERTEDIPELAYFFLRRFSLETKKPFTQISDEAMDRLLTHAWPGSVRELANTIERAVVLGNGPVLQLADLPPAMAVDANAATKHSPNPCESGSYHQAVQSFKRELVLQTLESCGWNRSAAARTLKLQRTYFSRLLKTLGIS